jgi:hypothetical protein
MTAVQNHRAGWALLRPFRIMMSVAGDFLGHMGTRMRDWVNVLALKIWRTLADWHRVWGRCVPARQRAWVVALLGPPLIGLLLLLPIYWIQDWSWDAAFLSFRNAAERDRSAYLVVREWARIRRESVDTKDHGHVWPRDFEVRLPVVSPLASGERFQIAVRSEQPGYLWVVWFDPSGRAELFYPNHSRCDNWIAHDQLFALPEPRNGGRFRPQGGAGQHEIVAMVTEKRDPFIALRLRERPSRVALDHLAFTGGRVGYARAMVEVYARLPNGGVGP